MINKLAEVVKSNEALEQELSDVTARLASTERNLNEITHAKLALEQEKRIGLNKLMELEEIKKEYEGTIDELCKRVADTEQDRDELSHAKEILEQQIREGIAKLRDLEDTKVDLEGTIDELCKRVATAEQEREELSNEKETLQSSLEEYANRYSELQQEYSNLEKVKIDNENQLHEYHNGIQELQQEKQALLSAKSSLETEIESLKDQIFTLEDDRKSFLQKRRQQTAEFNREQRKWTEERERLLHENYLLKESGATIEESKKMDDERRVTLEAKLKEEELLKSKIDNLESAKEDLTRQLQKQTQKLSQTEEVYRSSKGINYNSSSQILTLFSEQNDRSEDTISKLKASLEEKTLQIEDLKDKIKGLETRSQIVSKLTATGNLIDVLKPHLPTDSNNSVEVDDSKSEKKSVRIDTSSSADKENLDPKPQPRYSLPPPKKVILHPYITVKLLTC